jgi:hypothetical protein
MRHASEGVLRRLEDEPFAVADSTFEHIMRCRRCSARRREIAEAAGVAAGLLSGPTPVPDVDLGWEDFRQRLSRLARAGSSPAERSGTEMAVRAPAGGHPRLPARATAIAGAVAVTVAGGVAAAAALTGVFAPAKVVPVAVAPGDIRAVSTLLSFSNTNAPAGFPTSSGTGSLPFGTMHWDSSGHASSVASLADAASLAGMQLTLPARLPTGVGSPSTFVVQPKVTVTMTFDSAAGSLAGASVTLNVGPAVFVGYGSASGATGVPSLAVLALPRPTATSSGAALGEIENFLLTRPGIPANLAEEIRLLGNVSGVVPVPAPAGAQSKSVKVGRWQGVVITDPSHVASAVVWEDGAGIVHAVAGLVDQQEVLGVANQLG